MQSTQSHATATEILKSEHDVILVVLDCLEKVADGTAGGELDVRSAGEVLEFLGTFADRCHHGKEEGALFPMLVAKGLPQKAGPIAVMLSEHEQGRAEISAMRNALASDESARFAAHARAYVALLRDHIAKENGVLFPMADGMLDALEQAELLAAFDHVEADDLGSGVHERFLALVDGLARRLGVVAKERPVVVGGCCGHGKGACG
jgi:hemerythrin-like domain-containing protein